MDSLSLQVTYFGHITTDILQYISVTTRPEDRADGGLRRFLEVYHKQFHKVSLRCGTPAKDIPTMDELM